MPICAHTFSASAKNAVAFSTIVGAYVATAASHVEAKSNADAYFSHASSAFSKSAATVSLLVTAS